MRQGGIVRGRMLIVLVCSAVVATMATAGCEDQGGDGAAKTYRIRIAHQLTENTHLHQGLERFAELLRTKSDGRFEPKLYAGGTLGDSRALLENVRMGTVDVVSVANSLLSAYEPKTMLADYPFLFDTHAQAEQLLDGPIGHKMVGELPAKVGFRVLGYWVSGFRSIFSDKRFVRTPEDLKQLKIRVMESPIYQDTFIMLGAVATPISFGELYGALEQGVVDAAENDADAFYSQNFYEICKKFSLTKHSYTAIPLIISEAYYQKLPADLRQVLTEAADEAKTYERKVARAMNKQALDELEKAGVEIVEVDRGPFKAALSDFDAKYGPIIGEELMAEARAALTAGATTQAVP